jgi:hypothetical protein
MVADLSGDNASTETGRETATGIAARIRALAVQTTPGESNGAI